MKFNEECQTIYSTEIHIHFLIQFKVWLMTMDILARTISLSSSGKYLLRLEQPWQHIEGSGAPRNNICLHPLSLHAASAATESVCGGGGLWPCT